MLLLLLVLLLVAAGRDVHYRIARGVCGIFTLTRPCAYHYKRKMSVCQASPMDLLCVSNMLICYDVGVIGECVVVVIVVGM